MKIMKFTFTVLCVLTTLCATAGAQQQIKVDATPVVSAFNAVVEQLAKTKQDEQDKLVANITKLLQVNPPDNAPEGDRTAFNQAKVLAISKVLSAYPSGAAVRVRETKVVDIFQTSSNTITIGLASGGGLPVSFGFTFGRESRSRSADEIEIEGTYAYNESFAPQLIDVVRGDNALAILTKLIDIITKAQAQ